MPIRADEAAWLPDIAARVRPVGNDVSSLRVRPKPPLDPERFLWRRVGNASPRAPPYWVVCGACHPEVRSYGVGLTRGLTVIFGPVHSGRAISELPRADAATRPGHRGHRSVLLAVSLDKNSSTEMGRVLSFGPVISCRHSDQLATTSIPHKKFPTRAVPSGFC